MTDPSLFEKALSRALGRSLPRSRADDLAEWARHLRVVRGLAVLSVSRYVRLVSAFYRWLAAEGIDGDNVERSTVEQWLNMLFVVRRNGASTRHVALISVKSFFDWRETMGRGRNPAAGLRGPKVTKRVARKYTNEQVRSLLRSFDRSTVIGRRNYAFFLFMLVTCARRNEVIQLGLDQVELRERTGRVRLFGKGGKERVIEFGQELVEALRSWLHDRDALRLRDRAAVWVSTQGRMAGCALSIMAPDRILHAALRRAKLPPDVRGLHRLRVTGATALYDAGVDIEDIRIFLGHEDITTTRRYLAVSERARRVKMSAATVAQFTGDARKGVPLWARRGPLGVQAVGH